MANNTRANFYSAANPYANPVTMGSPVAAISSKDTQKEPKLSKQVLSNIGNNLAYSQQTGQSFVEKIKNPTFGTGQTNKEINKESGAASLGAVKDATSGLLQTPGAKEAIKSGATKAGQSLGLLSKATSVVPSVTGAAAWAAPVASALPAVPTGLSTAANAGMGAIKVAAAPTSQLLTGAADAGMKAVDLTAKGAKAVDLTTKGTQAATATTTAASGTGALVGAVTSLGIGLAGTGLSILGDNISKKAYNRDNMKGYGWGQAAKYGGMGMSLGSSIGGMIVPGAGALVGGAIGLVLGGIGGGIYGAINKKKILRERSDAQKAVTQANEAIDKENFISMTQYRDKMRQKNLMDQVNSVTGSYKKGGILMKYKNVSDAIIIEETPKEAPKKLSQVPIFKMGGALPQEYVDFDKLKDEDKSKYLSAVYQLSQEGDNLNSISKKTKLHPKVIKSLQEYIAKKLEEQQREAENQAIQKQANPMETAEPTQEYKRGGKVLMKKKVEACSCGCTPKFRRGGKLDIQKENVILDGPTHDEYNKTGVKGDKGLPVVKMTKGGSAFKVAEFEGGEMVLSHKLSNEIQKLRTEIKDGNEKAKDLLASLLQKELGTNTYDYTKLMS